MKVEIEQHGEHQICGGVVACAKRHLRIDHDLHFVSGVTFVKGGAHQTTLADGYHGIVGLPDGIPVLVGNQLPCVVQVAEVVPFGDKPLHRSGIIERFGYKRVKTLRGILKAFKWKIGEQADEDFSCRFLRKQMKTVNEIIHQAPA